MSAESQPITPEAFAEAIKSLPLSACYAKVSELRNSIAHLRRSNEELRLYIAEADNETESSRRELESYIAENEGVVAAMTERIALLRTEIEVNRGQQWIELDPEAAAQAAEVVAAAADEAEVEAMETGTTATAATDETTAAPTVNGASSTRATVGGSPEPAAHGGATTPVVNGASSVASTSELSSEAPSHAADRQQHTDVPMEVEQEEEGVYL